MPELVALYPRVSTQEQVIEGHSIPEQIERMTNYCAAMNWNVFKVYTDAGFSGANMNRPALQRLIKDVKAGMVTKVLVYKLDRLSRSQKDTLCLIEDVFLANNTDFVSMSENFDTSTPFGRAMVGILAVFAQLEREQIKERMSLGREARAKQGLFHGSGIAPTGYDYINGKLEVNEFEAMLVQQAFKMYSEGKSIESICRTFNESGMLRKRGKWTRRTVFDMLSRQTYLGYIVHNDKAYKGEHTPIIDESLFNDVQRIKAQKAFEHNEKFLRAGRAQSYLGGYLYCAHCKAKYSKNTRYYKQTRYHYYTCNSRTKNNPAIVKNPNCKNKIWRMDELDAIVFDEIKKLALDTDYIAEIKAGKEEDERPNIINTEIAKIDAQINKLLDLYTVESMPIETLQGRIQALNDKRLSLIAELNRIEEESKQALTEEETKELVTSFAGILENGTFEDIRTVIGAVIDKIEIDGDNITIHWNFA